MLQQDTAAETPIFEFVHTCKRFPGMDAYAVHDVSLSINRGEFITILGTSGSGKTTLMKMVNRLYDISSGDILFHGESVKSQPEVEYRRKVGYVVQQSGLFPHMSVADNIAVVPKILKWDKEKIASRTKELLSLVGLAPTVYSNRFPRQLSGGQQQRVGIARALAADPSAMLMDEPFGAIDAITRESLQNELLRIQKSTQKTILFVTHDINEAFKLGDRVIVMHGGELQQFDTPSNIMLHPANEFVSRLVGADNPMERIRAVRCSELAEKIPSADTGLTLDASLTINDALPFLLAHPTEEIALYDKNICIGTLDRKKLSQLMK